MGFKLKMARAQLVIRGPNFEKAPYVGHKGWVSMDATEVRDWDQVRSMILESYCLIAPQRSIAKMDGDGVAPSSKPSKRRKKRASKRTSKK